MLFKRIDFLPNDRFTYDVNARLVFAPQQMIFFGGYFNAISFFGQIQKSKVSFIDFVLRRIIRTLPAIIVSIMLTRIAWEMSSNRNPRVFGLNGACSQPMSVTSTIFYVSNWFLKVPDIVSIVQPSN